MKKIALLSLLVAAALLGTSCDQGLFGTNFFSAFEGYDPPNYNDATAGDLVKASEDPRFYEEMSDDEVVNVLITLETVYNSPDPNVTDEEKADAALLAADVSLKTGDAGTTLTALNNVIGDVVANSDNPDYQPPSFEDPADLAAFFSVDTSDPVTAQADLAAQIDDLVAAGDALAAYGSLLVSDPALASQDDNVGDTATKALLSGAVSVLYDSGNTSEQIAAAILDPVNNPLPSPVTIPDTGDPVTDLLGADLAAVVEAGLDLSSLGVL